MNVRSFKLKIVDNFDNELDSYAFDYVISISGVGFSIKFNTIETKLITLFKSPEQEKEAVKFTVLFIKNAYFKKNSFNRFVQKYTNYRIFIEYNDNDRIVSWEGKVSQLQFSEIDTYDKLDCSFIFTPGTPKFILAANDIEIEYSNTGKKYPFAYPYTYGITKFVNNEIINDYFDDYPLRIFVYGEVTNPVVTLSDSNGVYQTLEFDVILEADEYIVSDAINGKVYLYRGGELLNGLNYVVQGANRVTYLHAKKETTSTLNVSLQPTDTGKLFGSYRKYVL